MALLVLASCSNGNTGAPVSPDHTPPVITLQGTASVSIEVGQPYVDAGATAVDNIDGNITASIVTQNPVSTAAAATFTVTYNVSDRSGNAALQVIRTVNVVDTVAPVIGGTPLADIYVQATGITTPYTLVPPTATDIAGITSLLPSNTGPFPLGTTTITWTATDNSGLTATTTQRIIVQDTAPPVIAGTPLPTIRIEATGVTTPYTFTPPSASDASGIASVIANNTGPFSIGTTQITWTATDNSGLTTTAVQQMIVQDTTPPTIVGTPLADIYVQATGVTTPYTLTTPTATDLLGIASVSANTTGPFSVGTTQITWTAKDNTGLTTTATQNIVVQDSSTLTMNGTPLADIYVEATGTTTAHTLTAPTAKDTSGQVFTATASNTGPFKIGTTTITWTATKSTNNTVSATQNIIVRDTTAPTITISTGKAGGSIATASDTVDGNLTSSIKRSDTTVTSGGTPTVAVTYAVTDNHNNSAQKTITIGGVNWAALVAPVSSGIDLYAAAYGNSRFVTVGAGGDIYASADGYSWAAHASGVSLPLHDVVWGSSHFVAVGEQGTILTSQDGSSWAKQAAPLVRDMYGIVWSGSQYMAVGAQPSIGTTPIWSSSDGYTWSPHNTVQGTLYGIAWGNSQFVVVGAGGDIYTSATGNGWNHKSSSTTVDLYSIAWSGSTFVVVGAGGTILTSPNGTTWTKQTSPTTQTLRDVVWSGAQFIVVGSNSTVLTSLDGINWMTHTVPAGKQLKGVAYAGGAYVAVGMGGTIIVNGL